MCLLYDLMTWRSQASEPLDDPPQQLMPILIQWRRKFVVKLQKKMNWQKKNAAEQKHKIAKRKQMNERNATGLAGGGSVCTIKHLKINVPKI